MQNNNRRRFAIALCATVMSATGCASPDKLDRTPFVVEYSLGPGAAKKTGLQALTNTGAQIFASATLSERNSGWSGFGGTVSFPRWVRVTWREGVTPGEYWTTGTVVADHTIDVRSRIPPAFYETAKNRPGRVIKLQFRIKDDAVLFAWCVQEDSGGGHVDILNDGDFKKPTIFNGVVTDPGWERPAR